MPQRDRRYHVVLDAQAPEDLAARCSATWRDLLEVADRLRKHRHLADSNGDRRLTGSRDAVIDIQPRRPSRPPDGSPGQGSVRRRPPDGSPDDSSDGFTEGERHHE